MFHRSSQRRSRSSRVNARESHYTRGPTNGYEPRLSTTEDHRQFASDDFDYQDSSLRNASWGAHTAVVPRPDDSSSATSGFHSLTMEPEWSTPTTSYVDGQYDSGHYSSRLGFSEPAWEDPTVPFQQSSNGYHQDSVSPITSLPEEASERFFEYASRQTGLIPSSELQPGQIQTASTSRHWAAAETDAPSIRTFRRESTRARQGSYVRDFDDDRRDNAVIHTPMDQTEVVEEQDSSDSSGGSTPIDRDQSIDRFIGDQVNPWSPAFRYHTPVYQYPY
ncbi:hypothetical protein F4678DRAFT_188684 [Xylaria arbuscula]|nr:hypothetical protein F4678DRAFT_188684 [Xylaria arbuscula]